MKWDVNPEFVDRVRDRLAGYGKIGVLIDDDKASIRRTAREFYGGEELPRWWLVCCSCECAAVAIESILAVMDYRAASKPPGIVIADRRLPARCDVKAPDVVWDEQGPKDAAARRLAKAVDDWRAREKRHPDQLCSIYQTSFPYGGEFQHDAANSSRLTWLMRSSSVLHGLRQSLEKAALLSETKNESVDRLLRYGPTQLTSGVEALSDEHKYMRNLWARAVRRIAEQLIVPQDGGPTILLTGAGASLAPHAFAAGMPATPRLLQDTYNRFARSRRDYQSQSTAEPSHGVQRRCLCQEVTDMVTSPEAHDVDGLDQFVDLMTRGVSISNMNWSLETLFKEGNSVSTDVFSELFRMAMLECDRGLPYQHWLLAALPWDEIISTNFDTFHERAWDDHAARSPSLQSKQRRRSKRFPAEQLEDYMRPIQKPYGALHINERLALTHQQLSECEGKLTSRLDKWFSYKNGTLLVAGHSMRDPYLCRYFDGKADILKTWQVCWCVPEAYRAVSGRSGLTGWLGLMSKALDEPKSFADGSGPFPVTALELAYDLATECHNLKWEIDPIGCEAAER
jgi:hypothetical protein